MNKKVLRRVAAVGITSLIAVGSVAMFAGCTQSNNPEVTITYSFNGEDYEVAGIKRYNTHLRVEIKRKKV